jgi:hypothetical protein
VFPRKVPSSTKKKDEAHSGMEWDSDCSSSDSENEGLVASAFDNSHLFPKEHHICIMAKEEKIYPRETHKYTSSIDDESSDDEVDYIDLFKGLDRTKITKIKELIDVLNEKDRLIEKAIGFIFDEHDKFVM